MFRVFRFLPTRWWSFRAWKTWRTYAHWRLETYGIYYPHGELQFQSLRTLLLQLPSYLRWLKDLDRTRNLPLITRN